MSTDLVPVTTFDLVPQAASLAEQIANTDFAPQAFRNKPAAVMAAMLQGHELGIGPMASLAEIAVINGKPCMSAKLMRALVQRAGHDIYFKTKTNTKVTIAGRRREWPEGREVEVAWSMDDARAAGLSGGQNYRKYPRAMLAARATGEFCRDNFADVLGGIGYTPEELSDGDLVADGDLAIDSRDDIAPESPPTTSRRAAKPATAAKKTPAKKAAAPTTTAPAALPVPPLPGEPGFEDPLAPAAEDEDIVDAEVIEDDEAPATLADAVAAANITQGRALKRARELAGQVELDLPSAFDEIDGKVLELLVADLGIQAPAGAAEPPSSSKRNAKMWAQVAEAWPDEDDEFRDEMRRNLISAVSKGRTESSKELEPVEWDALFAGLDSITEGAQKLHLSANGWVLQTVPKHQRAAS